MQARKDRAALQAMRLENAAFAETSASAGRVRNEVSQACLKQFNTIEVAGGLEKVMEESDYKTIDPDCFSKNYGNSLRLQSNEKPRPSSTSKMVPPQPHEVLVTPMPVNGPALTTKAAEAVLKRQFTMQLMPMYRIRQRSAGLKPSSNQQSQKQAMVDKNQAPVIAEQPQLSQVRSISHVGSQKTSQQVTKRNSNMLQSATTAAPTQRPPKITPQAFAVKDTKEAVAVFRRTKSKKQGTRTSLKEATNDSGIRVRKVFMQSQQKSLNFGAKSAGKSSGFNLLTTSKEYKGYANQLLAPVKQRSGQSKFGKESSSHI